jgi:hypothetical protein
MSLCNTTGLPLLNVACAGFPPLCEAQPHICPPPLPRAPDPQVLALPLLLLLLCG